MLVLGVETSCDETGVAVYEGGGGLLGHRIYSQVAMHAPFGGVVPELASRDHVRKLTPLIREVLAESGVEAKNLGGVAYTRGPGLTGALLVGASVARSFAWALEIPAVGVHHMEAHLLAPMLEERAPAFPFLALLVSGGHTMLVEVAGVGRYRVLGETLDDAVGEAFDKTAKLLGLPYPGGPALEALARSADTGGEVRFPRPMTDRPGLDFSFSGLKTFALNAIHAAGDDPRARAALARDFQEAVVETLAIKCRRALGATGLKRLVIAGGVGANVRLRDYLTGMASEMGAELFYPRPLFCTDNGAMVAYLGWLRLRVGQHEGVAFDVAARWPLESLPAAG